MTWIAEPIGYANPDYYADAANSSERQLRADFAKYYQLREIAPFGLTPGDTAELNAHADDLAARWGRHELPHWRRMWETLQSAVMGWEARPELARRNFDQLARARSAGEFGVDDDLWRSLQQARAITGHGLDATADPSRNSDRRFPNLHLREPSVSATQPAQEEPDLRTSVEKTLGAPREIRAMAPAVSLDEVEEIIAATEEALDTEEQRSDLDTGRDARTALLPRVIREAPITHNYAESAVWELRQAALLREVQDLSCEHSDVADAFNGTDDQARIARLEALRDGVAAARRDALRAGVLASDVERAYILGRDGIYWSNEPSHPRLGRIAQLTEERDRACAELARSNSQIADPHHRVESDHALAPTAETASSRADFVAPRSGPAAADGGARIVEAIDAVLADADSDNWVASAEPQQTGDQVPVEREIGAEL